MIRGNVSREDGRIFCAFRDEAGRSLTIASDGPSVRALAAVLATIARSDEPEDEADFQIRGDLT